MILLKIKLTAKILKKQFGGIHFYGFYKKNRVYLQIKKERMFYFLQKFKIIQIIIMVVMTVLMAIQLFQQPMEFCYFDTALPFAKSLATGVSQHSGLFKGFLFLMVLAEGFILYQYFKKGAFMDNTSFFPVIWFFTFNAFACFLTPFTPIAITNLTIILLLMLNEPSSHLRFKFQLLLSGILIAINCFYDFSAVLLLLYLIISLAISRLEKFRDVLALLLGFTLPFIYIGTVYFFKGDFSVFTDMWKQDHFHSAIFSLPHISMVTIVCIAVFILLLPYIVIQLKILFDNKLIVIRKRFISLVILLITLLVMVLVSQVPLPYSLAYFSVPVTSFLSAMIPEKNFSIIKEVAIVLFAATIIVMSLGL